MPSQLLNPKDFRILIVDDAKTNIILLSSVLKNEGYEVHSAESGKEAFELIKEIQPDILLLDIMMPEMTGFELSAKLKDSIYSHIPIIFLSALTDTKDIVNAFKAGGIDFMTKPFKKEEVLVRLKTHLGVLQLENERKERIRVLREREQELNQLNENKVELMRMVSHDIKNPLTGIIGISQILLEEEDLEEEEKNQMLQSMLETSQKLMTHVKEVLDKTSDQNKDGSLNIESIKIYTLIKSVFSLNMLKAKMKNLRMELIQEDKELKFEVDPYLIETTLNILIINAIKFTQSGGEITIQVATPDNESVLISVTDTGIGIPSEMLDNFLIPNSYEKEPNLNAVAGSGLGLETVVKNIKAHNGKIWVNSKESEGTTFYIDLPLIHQQKDK